MGPARLSAWLVRGWRLAALVAAALLLQRTTPTPESALTQLTLADAQAFFPDAKRIDPAQDQSLLVQDGIGNRLGRLVTTSPDADAIIGYSGPTNVLVALDEQERVVGTRILGTQDTPDHVDKLRGNAAFERIFKQWRPASQPAPKLDGQAGSTLTAYAIVESIQKRLSGSYASLRFPTPLTLEEVKEAGFPDATGFEPNTPRLGWNLVRGPNRALLGYAVRSSPAGDEITGYAGPTETLIGLEPDELRIRKVVIRESYDTGEYVDRVRADDGYAQTLAKWTTREWATLNFEQAKLEGVAGATLTSYAMAEGIKRRFAEDAKADLEHRRASLSMLSKVSLWLLLAGGLIMTFTPLHGRRTLRIVWQLLLVGGLGLGLGQLLSLSLLTGWARHGLPWAQGPGLLALAALALLIPWAARRQIYCHHLCPHGAAQELLGNFRRLHVRLSAGAHELLGRIPYLTLGAAFIFALAWPSMGLANWEPFDAWALGLTFSIPAALALVGLVASIFVPQAYCKYGCPTGALLKLVRTSSDRETWGRRDSWAAGLLLLGGVIAFGTTSGPTGENHAQPASQAVTEIHGGAFGTTWTVKVRGAGLDAEGLKHAVEAEVERIEATNSHWRKNSAVSEFNRLESTHPFGLPEETVTLVEFGLRLSRATKGTYDLTVAPLTDAWGYGPSGKKAQPPAAAEIERLRSHVGWRKLSLNRTDLTLAKSDERTALDLGSVLQGYAADRIAGLLKQRGHKEYLIEVGGELLAAGAWRVGLEHPLRPREMLETLELKDQALSPSGLYRARRQAEGKSISHIISPLTGQPVRPTIEMCAVFHARCLEADGWATALMSAGFDEAKKLAVAEKLAVILVTPEGTVWKSPAAK